jgi:hypothetical protein
MTYKNESGKIWFSWYTLFTTISITNDCFRQHYKQGISEGLAACVNLELYCPCSNFVEFLFFTDGPVVKRVGRVTYSAGCWCEACGMAM